MSSSKKLRKKLKELERHLEKLNVDQDVKITNKLENECEAEQQEEVQELVVFGRVTECISGDPIIGAIVKAFLCRNGTLIPLVHTFSGCDGRFLLNIPSDMVVPGDKILVMASCTDHPPVPCDCDPSCTCP